MPDNLFETQYDITKKSRLQKFYESNKIIIFSTIIILIILLGSVTFYFENVKNKKIKLSEDYIQAKIYLEEGDKTKALNLLKEVIFSNDPTYSALCFFLILNQNLITDYKEISTLFNHILENNKFEKEIKNLLIFKKALISTNFANESELLEVTKPLLNEETLWKPHALLLLGDYFLSKNEYLKAKEFYTKIFSIKNLQKDIYEHARSQLAIITND
tara:strand:- start:1610 stop:2257 length:648 start_codon:yes stop_codon:yes gene_type:complete